MPEENGMKQTVCTWTKKKYLEQLIARAEYKEKDLKYCCEHLTERLFVQTMDTVLSHTHKYELWLEAVRPLDLLMAACRLRKI